MKNEDNAITIEHDLVGYLAVAIVAAWTHRLPGDGNLDDPEFRAAKKGGWEIIKEVGPNVVERAIFGAAVAVARTVTELRDRGFEIDDALMHDLIHTIPIKAIRESPASILRYNGGGTA